MRQEEVIALILAGFPDAQIQVEGEDCNFSALVISPAFSGMNLLKKQKAVLATVKQQIISGELHAMSVKAYTPEEWEQHKSTSENLITLR